MEAILYTPFILFAIGVLVYLGFQVKRDRERRRRADQYERMSASVVASESLIVMSGSRVGAADLIAVR